MIHLVYIRDGVIIALLMKFHSNALHLGQLIVVSVDLFDKVVIQVTIHSFYWLVRRNHKVATRVLYNFSALSHFDYRLNCRLAGLQSSPVVRCADSADLFGLVPYFRREVGLRLTLHLPWRHSWTSFSRVWLCSEVSLDRYLRASSLALIPVELFIHLVIICCIGLLDP